MFRYDYNEANKGIDCCAKDMKGLFSEIDMLHVCTNTEEVDMMIVKIAQEDKYKNQWLIDINEMSKLEIYRKFECEIKAKDYVLCDFLNYKQRSALSLARSGTLPIEIEKGCWRNISRENKICRQCCANTVEDLMHFCLYCTKYDNVRHQYYNDIVQDIPRFRTMTDSDKLNTMFTNPLILKKTANLILHMMKNRRQS